MAKSINDSDSLATVVVDALAIDHATLDPITAYEATLRSTRSVDTLWESLERIKLVSRLPSDARAWGRVGYVHVAEIRRRLYALTKPSGKPRFGPATVAVTMAMLKGILRETWRLGLMTSDDYHRAVDTREQMPERDELHGRYVPPEERARLRAAVLARGGSYALMVDALCAILFGAGLRAFEACALEAAQLEDDGAIVTLRGVLRKRRRTHSFALGKGEGQSARAWLAERSRIAVTAPTLFVRMAIDGSFANRPLNNQALAHILTINARDADVPPLTPHDCRRTFCSALLEGGADVAVTQRLMGHSDPKTTMKYDRRPAKRLAEIRQGIDIWGD